MYQQGRLFELCDLFGRNVLAALEDPALDEEPVEDVSFSIAHHLTTRPSSSPERPTTRQPRCIIVQATGSAISIVLPDNERGISGGATTARPRSTWARSTAGGASASSRSSRVSDPTVSNR